MTRVQKETEETLRAGNRIQSAPASDALLEQLRQIPATVREGYDKIPKKIVWAVAASIALLIALNFLSASNYSKNSNQQSTETSNSYFDHLKTL